LFVTTDGQRLSASSTPASFEVTAPNMSARADTVFLSPPKVRP
jgi:hypothetical protein